MTTCRISGKAAVFGFVGKAQRDKLGCVGVVTDSKLDAESFYRSHGFVPVAGVQEGSLHGEPRSMFLAIDSIAAALGHGAREGAP